MGLLLISDSQTNLQTSNVEPILSEPERSLSSNIFTRLTTGDIILNDNVPQPELVYTEENYVGCCKSKLSVPQPNKTDDLVLEKATLLTNPVRNDMKDVFLPDIEGNVYEFTYKQ